MSTQIVQFTHPGQEHSPDKKFANYKSWNTGPHKRKFMLSNGEFVDNGKLSQGKLMFWGEWEPPSYVNLLEKQSDKFYPKWIHTPLLPTIIPKNERLQNTDPFVFGESFKYLVCKQFKGKTRQTTQMAKLERGSVILFGSTSGNNRKESFFQLDTVFVVSNFVEYDISDANALTSMGNYREIVFKMAFPSPADFSLTLRLYIGATYNNPCNGMYSFVPARVWNNNKSGFPRIKLKGMDYLTNNLNSTPKITNLSINKIGEFWNLIRKVTEEQGCVEGVRFFY